ncbi:hypothetical protein GCM10023194_45090 [Planotetraspora phitsanulokensis]|uniref:Uncharacterized protein n=1 Tax=Planotetraspora phitsanulokensis TaxID=575192 RepID=A0A8J3U4K7_9ACTN|nr:hypothetical protein [Planotetraspora phitsanulokensis]GII38110.1 hypothetical protein Pph01_31130 [Planotetraspora phitsanulokensis]
MSNIFTDSVRVYALPDRQIDQAEAQWITRQLLGPYGSYHVPVSIRLAPAGQHADIQYGGGKSPDIVDFCEEQVGHRYLTIWGRHYNEGGLQQDEIWSEDVNEGPRRFCRYGFDEVRVIATGERPPVAAEEPWRRGSDGSWRLPVAGSYRTGNDRCADVGPCATLATEPPAPVPSALPTPTTPNESGDALTSIDPPWLAPLADEHPGVTLIEYRWRGRLVHRVREDDDDVWGRAWQHRCADDWDNCLDPDFLRFTRETDLVLSEEVYRRDEHDWQEYVRRYSR